MISATQTRLRAVGGGVLMSRYWQQLPLPGSPCLVGVLAWITPILIRPVGVFSRAAVRRPSKRGHVVVTARMNRPFRFPRGLTITAGCLSGCRGSTRLWRCPWWLCPRMRRHHMADVSSRRSRDRFNRCSASGEFDRFSGYRCAPIAPSLHVA